MTTEQTEQYQIQAIFALGIEKLSAIESQSGGQIDRIRGDAKARKIDVVRKIAEDIEKEYTLNGMDIGGIAQEIVTGLQGTVSQSLIYEALESKYKDEGKAKNRKGKTKTSVPASEQTNDEQKEKIALLTDGSAAIPDHAIPSGPLGSANPDRQISMDAFMPMVKRIINEAEDDGEFVRVRKELWQEFTSSAAKLGG